MRCFTAAVAAVLLVCGSSLVLGGLSKASDEVEQLFVMTCVRYAISLMGKQQTQVAARNCQLHLSKSGDFCTGYAELVNNRADKATVNQFCQTEYKKLHAGSSGVANGTQNIQVHTQAASSHALSENATFTPEQKKCQVRVENIIRLRLPHMAASKVVRLDCAQRFGRQAPLCKEVVKLFGQGNVRDTCKLLARKRPDMVEFCRRTTGKMVGTGLDGGALREAATDLCEMEFEQVPPLHVHEGCRFYADRLVKAHLDGTSNVSHFCATLTQRPISKQPKAAPVVVQKAGPTSTNAGYQTNLKPLSSVAAHHSNSPTAEQRRPPKPASIGEALHSVPHMQPLASAATPRTTKALDSLHALNPSGAQSYARVQIPTSSTPVAAPKVVAPAPRNAQSKANVAAPRKDVLAVEAPIGVRATNSSSGRIIPSVRRVVPQKTDLPTTAAVSGSLTKMKEKSDKTVAAPVSRPPAATSAAEAVATTEATASARVSSAAIAPLPAAEVPPTGKAIGVPTASVEDAEHGTDSDFGVPDAGTVDGVLSAMASMPTALPLSDVSSAPSAEAAQQQSPQQPPLRQLGEAASKLKAAPGNTQANGITVNTGASAIAANSEAAATAAEDDFLSNFLGEYGKSSGPKDVAVQHDPAAQQAAIPIPGLPPGLEALTASLVPSGPGAADVDALVSSFLARSG